MAHEDDEFPEYKEQSREIVLPPIRYDLTADPLEITKRLQIKWLTRMEYLLDNGIATSADMTNLARVLMANGWVLDPAKLPKSLRDKLTDHVEFDDDDDSGGVLLFRKREA